MKTKSGFTIVELIIVILVISIIATISVVAYNGVRGRGDASAAVEGLQTIEKAFKLQGLDNQWTVWPTEVAFGGVSNPTIQTVINYSSNSYLKSLMPTSPSSNTYPASAWTYDNDSDTVSSNCGSPGNGVNIKIDPVTPTQSIEIDKAVDDGNTNCGKVRYDSAQSRLYYLLSLDGTFTPERQ